jgi:hypothetical protein
VGLSAAPVHAESWHGAYSAQSDFTVAFARDEAAWRRLWAMAGGPPPRPLGESEAAVGIFLGRRLTGGHAVVADEPRAEGCVTVLPFRERLPSGFVTQALTNPWAVVTLPAPQGALAARDDRRDYGDPGERRRCP